MCTDRPFEQGLAKQIFDDFNSLNSPVHFAFVLVHTSIFFFWLSLVHGVLCLAERARIEAEVKAAEAASRMKEQNELKMRREREREAARMALQKV